MMEKVELIEFINSIENRNMKKYNIFSAYIETFKKYAQFKGRSQRSEYWWAVLAHLLIVITLEVIGAVLIHIDQTGSNPTAIIFLFVLFILLITYMLATFIPVTALIVRRLHDTGKSGWFMLILLFPYLGFFIMLMFMVTDSELGLMNKYGENPKGIKYFHLPEGYIDDLKNHSVQFIPGDLNEIETYKKMLAIISKIVPSITPKAMDTKVQSALKKEKDMLINELAIRIAYTVNLLISPQYSGKFYLKWKKISDEDLMSAFIFCSFCVIA